MVVAVDAGIVHVGQPTEPQLALLCVSHRIEVDRTRVLLNDASDCGGGVDGSDGSDCVGGDDSDWRSGVLENRGRAQDR
jgi:hypothetical protein